MATIYKKIAELRSKVDVIKKDSKNPFFNSNYADINSIERLVEPIEREVGLTHTVTSSVTEDGKQHLTLTVADIETAETLTSTLQIILDKEDMQKLIGGHTYGRRGLLVSFYSLEAEDDDGNSVVEKPKKQAKKSTTNSGGGFVIDAHGSQKHQGMASEFDL